MIHPRERMVKHKAVVSEGKRPARGLASAGLLFVMILVLAVWGTPAGVLAASFIERAQEYFEDGDLKAAELELKNAL